MSEESKSNKLGWFEAGIALILLVASGVGNYAAMQVSLASQEERLSGLEGRVDKNEAYDVFLTSQDEKIKEQTIRNEEKIASVEKNQEEFSDNVKQLTKEIRALREAIIELRVKGDKVDG